MSVLWVAMLGTGMAVAQVPSEGGTGWLPGWAEQLGIRLETTPAPDETFTELKAVVEDPVKLVPLWAEAKEGLVLTLTHSGYAAWTTEVAGAQVRPCVVVLKAEGDDRQVRLVPDRRTLQLKVGPPPFRGSNLRPGN